MRIVPYRIVFASYRIISYRAYRIVSRAYRIVSRAYRIVSYRSLRYDAIRYPSLVITFNMHIIMGQIYPWTVLYESVFEKVVFLVSPKRRVKVGWNMPPRKKNADPRPKNRSSKVVREFFSYLVKAHFQNNRSVSKNGVLVEWKNGT